MAFDAFGDLAAIQMGHAKVGNDDIKRFPLGPRSFETIKAGLAAIRRFDQMARIFEQFLEQLAKERFVVDTEDAQRLGGFGRRESFGVTGSRRLAHWENKANGRALAWLAFDLNAAVVPFDSPIHHRQTQTGPAAAALRRKERLEATLARLFIHAHT